MNHEQIEMFPGLMPRLLRTEYWWDRGEVVQIVSHHYDGFTLDPAYGCTGCRADPCVCDTLGEVIDSGHEEEEEREEEVHEEGDEGHAGWEHGDE